MSPPSASENIIIEAWHRNAKPWTVAVRERQIESRQRVTDQAVVDAVLACKPCSVLDIGCGEGWLARRLTAAGMAVTGVDVVAELIDQARRAGGGDFQVMSYESLANGEMNAQFDVVVCNFSLLGQDSVSALLHHVPTMLNPGGMLIVQTLHPLVACGDQPYRDGWRPGSWAGFSEDFVMPPPWYFRTLRSWVHLLAACGLPSLEIREPVHPASGKPASIIFMASAAGSAPAAFP